VIFKVSASITETFNKAPSHYIYSDLMSKQKIMDEISKRLSINGIWMNHGITGQVLMISVSKARSIVKEELEKVK
jgi:hypothetical protein